MNFIRLFVTTKEKLHCSCGQVIGAPAYLVHYKKNDFCNTALVRCIKCLREEVSEELDRIFGRKR